MAKNIIGLSITLILFILAELYIFQSFKVLFKKKSKRTIRIIFGSYFICTTIVLVYLINSSSLEHYLPTHIQPLVQGVAIGFIITKILLLLFLLLDDIRRLFILINKKVTKRRNKFRTSVQEEDGVNMDENQVVDFQIKDAQNISRSVFLSRMGFLSGGLLLGNFIIGTSNRYRYKVRSESISFAKLPAAFKGFKIAQISDIHSGSFDDKDAVLDGIKMIMAEKPDIILFTGDLVNRISSEIIPFKDIFSLLKAPFGVFSILGNHDYGDYHPFPTEADKKANIEALYQHHKDMGWDLLRNEHRIIDKDGDQIALLGVENWGNNLRFPRLGDITKAQATLADNIPFKILMSHDPSHWDAVVRPQFPDIALTLSGHTHGMQFGIDLPWFKWSPSQFVYKQWAGLYQKDEQYLYVNRGYGFLGYKGRVGILPEITMITLT